MQLMNSGRKSRRNPRLEVSQSVIPFKTLISKHRRRKERKKVRIFFTLLAYTAQTLLEIFKVHCWMEFHSCTHPKEWFCNGWHPIYSWHIYNEKGASFAASR